MTPIKMRNVFSYEEFEMVKDLLELTKRTKCKQFHFAKQNLIRRSGGVVAVRTMKENR